MPIDTSAMQTIKSTLIGMPKGFWGDDFSTPQQGVPVIKTNNLNYDGNIDFSDLVYRKINRDEIGDNFLESGDLLIEKSGGTKTHSVGYVSFFDGPNGTFVCNNFILCLRPNQSVILPRYLFYSIRHLYECGSFEDCFSKTTGIQNLQISAYLSKKVPTVSKEIQFFQTRLLDAIENDILRDHSLLNSLQELIKSRFNEMFGPRFETQPLHKLSAVATPLIGLTYHPENVSSSGTIVLRSGNIQNGELNLREDVVRVSGLKIDGSKMVKNLDILMCARNGSARLVGKTCLVKDPQEQMAFGAFMAVVRSPFPYFMNGFFNSAFFKNQLTNTGTTSVNQITNGMLNNYLLIIPTKDDEKNFSTFVQQIDKLKFDVEKRLALEQELFDTKMHEFFD